MRPDSLIETLNQQNAAEIPSAASWKAKLELGFTQRGDKTILSHRRHQGPLIVQRPFYPEDGVCHVYLLHPPGGVVAGDSLTLDIKVDPEAQALITTPAAGKCYRSDDVQANIAVQLNVSEQASLEWLPQETIIYEGAQLNSAMQIDLAVEARFIGWEILAMGRPAAAEGFETGQVNLSWYINRAGALFYMEKLNINPLSFAARWGLNGCSACGTLFAYPCTELQLQVIQELIAEQPGQGVTLIDNLLICRGLDSRADRLREFFHRVWQLLRTDIINSPACAPRIWAT